MPIEVELPDQDPQTDPQKKPLSDAGKEAPAPPKEPEKAPSAAPEAPSEPQSEEKKERKKPGPKPGSKKKKDEQPVQLMISPEITVESIALNIYTELLRSNGFRSKIAKKTHENHVEGLADKAVWAAKILKKRLERP